VLFRGSEDETANGSYRLAVSADDTTGIVGVQADAEKMPSVPFLVRHSRLLRPGDKVDHHVLEEFADSEAGLHDVSGCNKKRACSQASPLLKKYDVETDQAEA